MSEELSSTNSSTTSVEKIFSTVYYKIATHDDNVTTIQLISTFLAQNNDINTILPENNHSTTLLTHAALSSNVQIVKYLLENHADMEYPIHNTWLTTLNAISTLPLCPENLEIIQLLLRNGANPNTLDINHRTPLYNLFATPFDYKIEYTPLYIDALKLFIMYGASWLPLSILFTNYIQPFNTIFFQLVEIIFNTDRWAEHPTNASALYDSVLALFRHPKLTSTCLIQLIQLKPILWRRISQQLDDFNAALLERSKLKEASDELLLLLTAAKSQNEYLLPHPVHIQNTPMVYILRYHTPITQDTLAILKILNNIADVFPEAEKQRWSAEQVVLREERHLRRLEHQNGGNGGNGGNSNSNFYEETDDASYDDDDNDEDIVSLLHDSERNGKHVSLGLQFLLSFNSFQMDTTPMKDIISYVFSSIMHLNVKNLIRKHANALIHTIFSSTSPNFDIFLWLLTDKKGLIPASSFPTITLSSSIKGENSPMLQMNPLKDFAGLGIANTPNQPAAAGVIGADDGPDGPTELSDIDYSDIVIHYDRNTTPISLLLSNYTGAIHNPHTILAELQQQQVKDVQAWFSKNTVIAQKSASLRTKHLGMILPVPEYHLVRFLGYLVFNQEQLMKSQIQNITHTTNLTTLQQFLPHNLLHNVSIPLISNGIDLHQEGWCIAGLSQLYKSQPNRHKPSFLSRLFRKQKSSVDIMLDDLTQGLNSFGIEDDDTILTDLMKDDKDFVQDPKENCSIISRCCDKSVNSKRPLNGSLCQQCGVEYNFQHHGERNDVCDCGASKWDVQDDLIEPGHKQNTDYIASNENNQHKTTLASFRTAKEQLHYAQNSMISLLCTAQMTNQYNTIMLLLQKSILSPVALYTILDILSRNTCYQEIISGAYITPIEIIPNCSNVAMALCTTSYDTHTTLSPQTFLVQKEPKLPKLISINPYQFARHGNLSKSHLTHVDTTPRDQDPFLADNIQGEFGGAKVPSNGPDFSSTSSISHNHHTVTAATQTHIKSRTLQTQSEKMRHSHDIHECDEIDETTPTITANNKNNAKKQKNNNTSHKDGVVGDSFQNPFLTPKIEKEDPVVDFEFIHSFQINSHTDHTNKTTNQAYLASKKVKQKKEGNLSPRLVLASLCLIPLARWLTREFSSHIFTLYSSSAKQCVPLYHEQGLQYPEQQLFIHIASRIFTLFQWCQAQKFDFEQLFAKKPIFRENCMLLEFLAADSSETLYLTTRAYLHQQHPELRKFVPYLSDFSSNSGNSHMNSLTATHTYTSSQDFGPTSPASPAPHPPGDSTSRSTSAGSGSGPTHHNNAVLSPHNATPSKKSHEMVTEYILTQHQREKSMGIIQPVHFLREYLRTNNLSTPLFYEPKKIQNFFFTWLLFSPFSLCSPFGIGMIKHWFTHIMRLLRYHPLNFSIFTRLLYVWLRELPPLYTPFKIQLFRIIHDNPIASKSVLIHPVLQLFEAQSSSNSSTSSFSPQANINNTHHNASSTTTTSPSHIVVNVHNIDLSPQPLNTPISPQHHHGASQNAFNQQPHIQQQQQPHIQQQQNNHTIQQTSVPFSQNQSSQSLPAHYSYSMIPTMLTLINRQHRSSFRVSTQEKQQFAFDTQISNALVRGVHHLRQKRVVLNNKHKKDGLKNESNSNFSAVTTDNTTGSPTLQRIGTNESHTLPHRGANTPISAESNSNSETSFMSLVAQHSSAYYFAQFQQDPSDENTIEPHKADTRAALTKDSKQSKEIGNSISSLSFESQLDPLGLHMGLQQIRMLITSKQHQVFTNHSRRRFQNQELRYNIAMFPTPLQLDYQIYYIHKPSTIQKHRIESLLHSKEIDKELQKMKNAEVQYDDTTAAGAPDGQKDERMGHIGNDENHDAMFTNPAEACKQKQAERDAAKKQVVRLMATQNNLAASSAIPAHLTPTSLVSAAQLDEQLGKFPKKFTYVPQVPPFSDITRYNPFKYTQNCRPIYDEYSSEYFSLLIHNSHTVLCKLPKGLVNIMPVPDEQELQNVEDQRQAFNFRSRIDRIPELHDSVVGNKTRMTRSNSHSANKHTVRTSRSPSIGKGQINQRTDLLEEIDSPAPTDPDLDLEHDDHDEDGHYSDDGDGESQEFISQSDSVYKNSPSIGHDGNYHKSLIPRQSHFQNTGSKKNAITLYLSKLMCEAYHQPINRLFYDVIVTFLYNPFTNVTLHHWFDASLLYTFLSLCGEFNQFTVDIVDLLLSFPDNSLTLDLSTQLYYIHLDQSLQSHVQQTPAIHHHPSVSMARSRSGSMQSPNEYLHTPTQNTIAITSSISSTTQPTTQPTTQDDQIGSGQLIFGSALSYANSNKSKLQCGPQQSMSYEEGQILQRHQVIHITHQQALPQPDSTTISRCASTFKPTSSLTNNTTTLSTQSSYHTSQHTPGQVPDPSTPFQQQPLQNILTLRQKKLLALRGLNAVVGRKEITHTEHHVAIVSRLLNYIIDIDEQLQQQSEIHMDFPPHYIPATQSSHLPSQYVRSSIMTTDDENSIMSKSSNHIVFDVNTTTSTDLKLSQSVHNNRASSPSETNSPSVELQASNPPSTGGLKRQVRSHTSLASLAEMPVDMHMTLETGPTLINHPASVTFSNHLSQCEKNVLDHSSPSPSHHSRQNRKSSKKNSTLHQLNSQYFTTFSNQKQIAEIERQERYRNRQDRRVARETSAITIPFLLANFFTSVTPSNIYSIAMTELFIKYQYFYNFVVQRNEQATQHTKFGFNEIREFLKVFNHPMIICGNNRAQMMSSANKYIAQLMLFPQRACFDLSVCSLHHPTLSTIFPTALAEIQSDIAEKLTQKVTSVQTRPQYNHTVYHLVHRYALKEPTVSPVQAFLSPQHVPSHSHQTALSHSFRNSSQNFEIVPPSPQTDLLATSPFSLRFRLPWLTTRVALPNNNTVALLDEAAQAQVHANTAEMQTTQTTAKLHPPGIPQTASEPANTSPPTPHSTEQHPSARNTIWLDSHDPEEQRGVVTLDQHDVPFNPHSSNPNQIAFTLRKTQFGDSIIILDDVDIIYIMKHKSKKQQEKDLCQQLLTDLKSWKLLNVDVLHGYIQDIERRYGYRLDLTTLGQYLVGNKDFIRRVTRFTTQYTSSPPDSPQSTSNNATRYCNDATNCTEFDGKTFSTTIHAVPPIVYELLAVICEFQAIAPQYSQKIKPAILSNEHSKSVNALLEQK